MKIPKFKSESEEADWWYKNRHKIKWGKPLVHPDGRPMTAAEVVAAHIAKQKQTEPITIRLSVADLELAKRRAERKGIGYQTYLKSVIHEALTAQ